MINYYKTLTLTLLFTFTTMLTSGQASLNVPFLNAFSAQKTLDWKASQKRVIAYAKANKIDIRQVFDNGSVVQLMDVVNGQPVYYITDNVGAAITTRAYDLWEGGSTGLNLTGEGYNALGVWDGGAVRLTHQEFTNSGPTRITQVDGATALNDHATHVAGTLVAGGVNANSKGMSYKAPLKAFDWNSDAAEMATAAANGLEISNHSYGTITGWYSTGTSWVWYGVSSVSPTIDYRFGFYGTRSNEWDAIAYNAPNYLIVKSAGNDRGQGPSNAGQPGVPEKDGGESGFDCVGDGTTAKNIMAIGAVNQVSNYTGSASVVMSSFSGWGPTDDGRIKPDVVAKGVSTFSAGSASNTTYTTKSGTSMAAPSAAGTMALVRQHYMNTHNNTPMRSSTLKGLMIHTADEAGPAAGPDYMFGWGLMNAKRAAEIISEDDVSQNVIDEITLVNNTTYTRQLEVNGTQPLKVTICWTDPPAAVPVPALNARTPMLMHDLDLKIVDQIGNTYFPYRLNPEMPNAAPLTDGKNFVDNVEQVFIALPAAGTYNVVVNHEGPLTSSQVFSIIISGSNESGGLPLCSPGLTEPSNNATGVLLNQTIKWETATLATAYKVYFGTDGEGTQTPVNVYNGLQMTNNYFNINLQPSTSYYLKIVPLNAVGSNADCSAIWKFTTVSAIAQFPYIIDGEGIATPLLPQSWQQLQYSRVKWASTNLSSFQGSQSIGCFNPTMAGQGKQNSWLISPPIAVSAGKEYTVSFFYKALFPDVSERIGLYWGNAVDTSAFTTKLLDLNGFTGALGWQLASAMLLPATTGFGYLAWRAESANGFGVFIDQIMVDNWGAVQMSETEVSKIRAQYNHGILKLQLTKSYKNALLRVIATDGRVVYSEIISEKTGFEKPLDLSPGMYVVALTGDGVNERAKILVK